jgi:hypothetical protein
MHGCADHNYHYRVRYHYATLLVTSDCNRLHAALLSHRRLPCGRVRSRGRRVQAPLHSEGRDPAHHRAGVRRLQAQGSQASAARVAEHENGQGQLEHQRAAVKVDQSVKGQPGALSYCWRYAKKELWVTLNVRSHVGGYSASERSGAKIRKCFSSQFLLQASAPGATWRIYVVIF